MTIAPAIDFKEIARTLVASASRHEASQGLELVESVPSAQAIVDPVDADSSSVVVMSDGTTRRLEDLPKELGVLLASVGVLGFILPGIAGTPALIAGGLVLWPRTFGKVEGWFSGRFPVAHRQSLQQVGRFLDDLDRRYPSAPTPKP